MDVLIPFYGSHTGHRRGTGKCWGRGGGRTLRNKVTETLTVKSEGGILARYAACTSKFRNITTEQAGREPTVVIKPIYFILYQVSWLHSS